MNSPEYGEQPAEQITQTPLIDRLVEERNAAGGLDEYVAELCDIYESSGEHRPNMLQLKRFALYLIDTENTAGASSLNAQAFFKGELLAYTASYYLIGPAWPEVGYRTLNDQFTDSRTLKKEDFPNKTAFEDERTRFDELTDMERRLEIANKTIGGLEVQEPGMMPYLFDEMIENWAIDGSDDTQEQLHIIMGFRYVLGRVAKMSKTSDEFSAVVKEEIEDITSLSTEKLPGVREKIMESFAKHYLKANISEDDSDEKYAANLDYITYKLLRDFDKIEELTPGDEIIAYGRVMFILEDSQENDSSAIARVLPTDARIEGAVGHLVAATIPGPSLFEDLSSEEINKFGVCLEIKDAIIIHDDTHREILESTQTLSIVLSYPGADISKYL